jgi:hypothetical protein
LLIPYQKPYKRKQIKLILTIPQQLNETKTQNFSKTLQLSNIIISSETTNAGYFQVNFPQSQNVQGPFFALKIVQYLHLHH